MYFFEHNAHFTCCECDELLPKELWLRISSGAQQNMSTNWSDEANTRKLAENGGAMSTEYWPYSWLKRPRLVTNSGRVRETETGGLP